MEKWFKRAGLRLMVLCFWIIIWGVLSRIINQELFLPSPISVLTTIFEIGKNTTFWISIGNSFIRIILGFFLGLIIGAVLALISYKSKVVYELLSPLMKVIKAIPVASFIILALV